MNLYLPGPCHVRVDISRVGANGVALTAAADLGCTPSLSARASGPSSAPARKRRQRAPDGLRTLGEAAAKLGCSVKTVRGHIASGALRYVPTGLGSKRKRRMVTDAD